MSYPILLTFYLPMKIPQKFYDINLSNSSTLYAISEAMQINANLNTNEN